MPWPCAARSKVDGEHAAGHGGANRRIDRTAAGAHGRAGADHESPAGAGIGPPARVNWRFTEAGKIYVTQRLNRLLLAADDEARRLKDGTCRWSILAALIQEEDRTGPGILKEMGVTSARFLEALTAVRSNQQVTSDNPETAYEALEKYGLDLVALARQGQT